MKIAPIIFQFIFIFVYIYGTNSLAGAGQEAIDKFSKDIKRIEMSLDGLSKSNHDNLIAAQEPGEEDLIFRPDGKHREPLAIEQGVVICSLTKDFVSKDEKPTTLPALRLSSDTEGIMLDDFLFSITSKNYRLFKKMSDSKIDGIPLPRGYVWEEMNELQRRTFCAVSGLVEAACFDCDATEFDMYAVCTQIDSIIGQAFATIESVRGVMEEQVNPCGMVVDGIIANDAAKAIA
jgi:hypothetical protein